MDRYLFFKDMLSYRLSFIDRFCFMFLCWFLGIFWPGPAISMACLRRLSEFGHARGDPQGRRWGPENDEEAKKRSSRGPQRRSLWPLRTDEGLNEYHFSFFCRFFWICKQWKPCWKRLFESRAVIRFSFIQELTKRRSRGWTWAWKVGSTDRLTVFFRLTVSLCRVWMWIHFRWPIPRWIWPCDCFEKLLRSTAQWFKNLIHDSQHDLIHVFHILLKKCLDKFCVFVNQVRSMVLEVFYNWRRCLWSQGRKVRENIFLVFQLTTFRCVFFLCFYERFEFRHP